MVSERSLDVLRAIVNDYVASKEPVGSKSLVERHSFGVSAATIRNDMAQLEEEELIAAPHTSSGRIPTDKGYRLFVDHLADARPLTGAQRSAIQRFLDESVDLNDVLTRTVRLLAHLTNTVALVQAPTVSSSRIRRIEFVMLSPTRLLSIVITSSGAVQQRVVELAVECPVDELDQLSVIVNATVNNRTLDEATASLPLVLDTLRDPRLEPVVHSLIDQITLNRTDRLVMAGAAHLVRTENDFPSSITPVLDAIEEQVVLLRLFDEMGQDQQQIVVSIGRENHDDSLTETSIVTSPYRSPGPSVARVGLVGPLRMDYSGNIAAVRAVAHYLSRIFGD